MQTCPATAKAAPHNGLRGSVAKVGGWGDDDRAVAAQFERDPLVSCPAGKFHSHFATARKGEECDIRVRHQRVAHHSAIPGDTAAAPAPEVRLPASHPPIASAWRGVCSAGLKTTELPPPRAGPILCAASASGTFQGVIAPTTTELEPVSSNRCVPHAAREGVKRKRSRHAGVGSPPLPVGRCLPPARLPPGSPESSSPLPS